MENTAGNVSAQTVRKNMLWNVAGSFGFIGAQWMMTILIVHLGGYTEAGYLSLGLSLTNVFTNIAYFSIRNFQVSDASGKYATDIYVTHRVFAALAALLLYALFVLANGYPLYVTVFLLLFMGYRLSEPLVDVLHGIDQKVWRLDISGKSFFMRGILTLTGFIAVEMLTGSLVITTVVMLCGAYGVILFYDIPRAYRCEPFRLCFDKKDLTALTKECFPLFVYAVCLNAVVPIPRYFLERIAGSEVLGYYASVAIPASVIQLLSSYIFTTFTVLFTEYLRSGEKGKFLTLFWRLTAAIAVLVLAAAVGCGLLGEWALVLLFTEKIRAYSYLLTPTVLCCGIIALIWFAGAVLTIMRDMKGLLLGSVAGTVAAAGISYPCIMQWGVDGVNTTLFVSSAITLGIFAWRLIRYVGNWRPSEANEEK